MPLWKKIIFGFIGVVGLAFVVILVAAAMQPGEYRVERSRTIDAPPEVVHGFVNDFSEWRAWSPWEELDPNMHRETSTPPSGENAWYAWRGNDDVGSGKMTITGSRPERIDIRLEFLEPFESTSRVSFAFAPQGGGTRVTWAMEGTNDLTGKVFSLLVDMDSMIGADFERGLSKLERAATQR